VNSPFHVRATRRLLVAAALAGPLALSAQTAPPELDWRQANEAVGTLKRGHADVLKWEQANPSAEPADTTPVTGLALPTPEHAVRQAWRLHRDLTSPLARLGDQNGQWIASGRWTELDPGLQRRIDDMDELLEVAAEARKAWFQAVAAQQILKHQRDLLDAAQAASELGQRMVSVGNWSRLQQSRVQLATSAARMDHRRAQYAAVQAQAKLLTLLGLSGEHDAVALPDRLPDPPTQALEASDLRQRAAAVQAQLPAAERMRNRVLTSVALGAYQASHALAQASRDDALKERTFITEETVLHYNGMLKSVWDLLDEVRNQAQATIDAIGAQRDFWIADTDLQWVLQGGSPDSFVSLGGGAEAPAAAAH
jgi:outer membrane protein TolC